MIFGTFNELKGMIEFIDNKHMYLDLFLRVIRKEISIDVKDMELAQATYNTLMGLDGIREKQDSKPTVKQRNLAKMNRYISEIQESYKLLGNILVYINNPLSKKVSEKNGIAGGVYLRYHFENYLHEINLLRNRLISYLRLTKKFYKGNAPEELLELEYVIENAFGGILKTRGVHVHESRFSDKYIDSLHLQELFLKYPNKGHAGVIRMVNQNTINRARDYYSKVIKDNNKNIEKLIDDYFKVLYQISFRSDGEFIFSIN